MVQKRYNISDYIMNKLLTILSLIQTFGHYTRQYKRDYIKSDEFVRQYTYNFTKNNKITNYYVKDYILNLTVPPYTRIYLINDTHNVLNDDIFNVTNDYMSRDQYSRNYTRSYYYNNIKKSRQLITNDYYKVSE